jgi:hypothetical protein
MGKRYDGWEPIKDTYWYIFGEKEENYDFEVDKG